MKQELKKSEFLCQQHSNKKDIKKKSWSERKKQFLICWSFNLNYVEEYRDSPWILIKLLQVPKTVYIVLKTTRSICLMLASLLSDFCMHGFQRLIGSQENLEWSIWVNRANVWLFCSRSSTGTTSMPQHDPGGQELHHIIHFLAW